VLYINVKYTIGKFKSFLLLETFVLNGTSGQIDGSSHETCDDYFILGLHKTNVKKLARSLNFTFRYMSFH
jgi:hypothetical protein